MLTFLLAAVPLWHFQYSFIYFYIGKPACGRSALKQWRVYSLYNNGNLSLLCSSVERASSPCSLSNSNNKIHLNLHGLLISFSLNKGTTTDTNIYNVLRSSTSFHALFEISNSDQVIREILSDFSESYCDFRCHDLEQANNVTCTLGKPKSRYSTQKHSCGKFLRIRQYHSVVIWFHSHLARSEIFRQSS